MSFHERDCGGPVRIPQHPGTGVQKPCSARDERVLTGVTDFDGAGVLELMPYPSPEQQSVPRPAQYYPQWMPPVHYPAPPRPRGNPDRRYFRAGTVGLILLAATGLIAGISDILQGYLSFYESSYPIWVPITGTFVMVSSILGAVGYFGKFKNYGSGMGLAAGIYLLIGGVLFFALTYLAIEPRSYDSGYESVVRYYSATLLMWAGHIVFGVAPILLGVSHFVSRYHMTLPGLNIASGILLIIGGSFVISYILAPVGFFILTAAAICAAIAFAKAPVYEPESLPQAQVPPGYPTAYPPAYGWSPYQPRPPY